MSKFSHQIGAVVALAITASMSVQAHNTFASAGPQRAANPGVQRGIIFVGGHTTPKLSTGFAALNPQPIPPGITFAAVHSAPKLSTGFAALNPQPIPPGMQRRIDWTR